MKKRNIQKIIEPIVRRPGCTSFAVIGDPGCEGLGTGEGSEGGYDSHCGRYGSCRG